MRDMSITVIYHGMSPTVLYTGICFVNVGHQSNFNISGDWGSSFCG